MRYSYYYVESRRPSSRQNIARERVQCKQAANTVINTEIKLSEKCMAPAIYQTEYISALIEVTLN